MAFLDKYPISTTEALHFPLMFAEKVKSFHVPGIPYAKLEFLYEFCKYAGSSEGTVRTALSRMNRSGYVKIMKSEDTTRYRASPLQIEIMQNRNEKLRRNNAGFTIVIYSFEKKQEKERILIRSLLENHGFVRFAQNSYISVDINEAELRKKLNDLGLSENYFLFKLNGIADQDMQKLAIAWKVHERASFLEDFHQGMKLFLDSSDGSDGDLFNRYGAAWVSYFVHVHRTEPPLPHALLPKNYAYAEITGCLEDVGVREYKKMLRHYMDGNR